MSGSCDLLLPGHPEMLSRGIRIRAPQPLADLALRISHQLLVITRDTAVAQTRSRSFGSQFQSIFVSLGGRVCDERHDQRLPLRDVAPAALFQRRGEKSEGEDSEVRGLVNASLAYCGSGNICLVPTDPTYRTPILLAAAERRIPVTWTPSFLPAAIWGCRLKTSDRAVRAGRPGSQPDHGPSEGMRAGVRVRSPPPFTMAAVRIRAPNAQDGTGSSTRSSPTRRIMRSGYRGWNHRSHR